MWLGLRNASRACPAQPDLHEGIFSDMTSQQIAEHLTAKFGAQIRQALPGDRHPRVHVNASDWRPIAEHLRHEPALHLDWLANLSGVDYVADEMMCVVYDLWSFDLRHPFAVKVYCPRGAPHVPSVTDLWRAADRSEEHTSELQSPCNIVCRLLLEKKKYTWHCPTKSGKNDTPKPPLGKLIR